jgi:hypothetical protein
MMVFKAIFSIFIMSAVFIDARRVPIDKTDNQYECSISVYTPKLKNGVYITADGEKNTDIEGIASVPLYLWDKYKGTNIIINNNEYIVRDNFAEDEDVDFVIFSNYLDDDKHATCSWIPNQLKDSTLEPENEPDTGGEIVSCIVTYYTSSPSENHGSSTTADDSPLNPDDNIVAVSESLFASLKHKKLRFEGKTYTVRDSCSSCNRGDLGVDILVHSKAEAMKNGIKKGDCEIF